MCILFVISSFPVLINYTGTVLTEKRRILPKDVPNQMAYANYSGLVAKWGVEMAGWTEGDIVNPGTIQTSGSLKRLLDALRKGHCYWRVLTQTEWDQKIEDQVNKEGKSRKRRKDFGTTKGPQKSKKVTRSQTAGDGGGDDDEDAKSGSNSGSDSEIETDDEEENLGL